MICSTAAAAAALLFHTMHDEHPFVKDMKIIPGTFLPNRFVRKCKVHLHITFEINEVSIFTDILYQVLVPENN